MRKFQLLIILFTFSLSKNFAQKSKYGNVKASEIKETKHHIEDDADAAILYQNGNLFTSGGNLIYDVYRKIKIYKSADNSLSEITLRLFTNDDGDREYVDKIEAYTYNLENDEIVKHKLDRKNIVTKKIDKNWREERFALPKVKDGSIIEYKYKIRSPFLLSFPRLDLQYNVPVNATDYLVEYPEIFKFRRRIYGDIPVEIDENTRAKGGGNNTRLIIYNVHTFKTNYIPSIKSEPFIFDINEYRGAIRYYRSGNWNKVAKRLLNSQYFGKQIDKKNKEFNAFIDSLETLSYEEKINSIYNKVRSEYIWNNYIGEYCDECGNKFLKEKVGNTGDINLLLLNLLRKAKIEAYPIVSKNAYDGYLNPYFPDRTEIDYLIIEVKNGEQSTYLDATDSLLTPGMLPGRAVNLYGIKPIRIKTNSIDGDQFKGNAVRIINPNIESHLSYTKVKLNDLNELVCESTTKYNNLSAYNMRKFVGKLSSKDLVEKLEDQNEDYLIENVEVQNLYKLENPLSIKSSYTMEDQVDEVDGFLYLNPILDKGIRENLFKAEERIYSINLTAAKSQKDIIIIDIPENYVVESIPEAIKINLPNDLGSFVYNSQQIRNTIQTTIEFKLNESNFPSTYYDGLKKFYEQMVSLNSRKVVLKMKDE